MAIELGELTFLSLRTKLNKETGITQTEVTLKVNSYSQEAVDAVESIVIGERLKVNLELLQPRLR